MNYRPYTIKRRFAQTDVLFEDTTILEYSGLNSYPHAVRIQEALNGAYMLGYQEGHYEAKNNPREA